MLSECSNQPAKSVSASEYAPKGVNKEQRSKKNPLTSSGGMRLTSSTGSREMKRPIILSTSAFSQGMLGLQPEIEELTEEIQRNAAFIGFAVVTHRQDIAGSVSCFYSSHMQIHWIT